MSAKEATLADLRRRNSAPKAGSVWESRMKLDGGFKVFNAAQPEKADPTGAQMDKKSPSDVARPKQSPANGKRKTWKSESSGGSPVQIARQGSEAGRKSLDHELSKESADSKKSPVSINKKRSLSAAAIDGGKIKNCEMDVDPNRELGKIKNCDVDVDPNRELGKIDKTPPEGVDDSKSDESLEGIEVEDKKLVHTHSSQTEISFLLSPAVKRQPPPKPSPTKTNPIFLVPDHSPDPPRRHSILQSFVDLVMWRDVSKSAFVFGIGAFGIISSAYSKDLNISFISVISYLGLVYLAAIFLFRSLIRRRSAFDMDGENQECVVGEDEAFRVVKLFLPYVNEFLLKLRALFSGDPATTMKLAVLLFVLARCGGFITIWKMAKLGFVVVFTVPKICSAYSSQLTAFGTFWIQRFRDAWESCFHKKAVAFAIFTLVWNLSSIVARIWAVFMLFVAFKYYQQSLIEEGWLNEENNTSIGGQKSGQKSTKSVTSKQKKVC